jgi:hypothetical protein
MSRIHWVTPFLLSYIHTYVSFAEVGKICRAVFREPMHLCTCVSEEGDLRASHTLGWSCIVRQVSRS